ncbi:uncharacterized protein BX663DRAFT_503740 [Cokeromyces recurvatus]|uniref:uncharacterized protein n=1 Tax=Cokeromyces recurvatus TaxID=90255 RepID=UPI00221F53C0|nr:uncharacterized protein BX663DRAFT_503740 [Cokeromyces recurvatus]KAI7904836.1 hypothetical protein BX663DRAFT_503740 [Cokeromyces recurvatus]
MNLKVHSIFTSLFFVLLIIPCLQLASAQEMAMNHAEHDMLNEEVPAFNATGDEPMSYALLPDNKGLFYIHVTFMSIAFWILMPIGIMLGIARSNLHMPIQILTFTFAMFGFFFGKLYGHSTPHLYQGNIHHTFGWILYILFILQFVAGFVRKIANAVKNHIMAESNQYEAIGLVSQEQGRSIRSDSLMSGSTLQNNHDNVAFDDEDQISSFNEETLEIDQEDPLMSYSFTEERRVDSISKRLINMVLPYIPNFIKRGFEIAADNTFTNTICRFFHLIMGRIFVLLIFTQTISGLVVYHGVCRGWTIFGCIAHLIKGAVFYFYGIITFARYLGAFSEKGWAWNYVENGNKFSFEMIECFLIFFYGITNTWMEHFGQDSTWTHKDLEHASLAFMFWWAGLLGMLIESRAIRRMLEKAMPEIPYKVSNRRRNRSSNSDEKAYDADADDDNEKYSLKKKYSPANLTHFNPIPALTVFMTGISMGNHHQDTIYSSRVHYLWGLLISAASICRFITYLSLFRNPPKNNIPTRPPSEALGAFLLVAGAILFMASNHGTMLWLRRNHVDSMFLLNVTVSLTAMTLSYVTFLVIIKAWAINRESNKCMKKLNYYSHRQRLRSVEENQQQVHFEVNNDNNEL